MTRRERLEKKLEKRLDWAESRDKQADAAHERVHQIADGIPFGQPILVGHHSERRARRDQERMHSGMSAAVENSRMADHHRQAADGIERALATSVFSDDEDAVERLTEIVAELEAKRDRWKAENAVYRKEHKDELKAMGVYERSQSVPHASYSISNLGATIRQKKDRIVRITRERELKAAGVRAGGRVMTSRYGGVCPDCGEPFAKGDPIVWYRTTREACHAVCPVQEEAREGAVKAVGAPVSAAELGGDPTPLASHRLEYDPPHGLSSASRQTCSVCGAAVLQVPGGVPYGSAVERTCEEQQARNEADALNRSERVRTIQGHGIEE
jgi:hypothetical protein